MTRVKEVLAGRYELVEELGRGGMGVVYAATDRSLHRRVAVKVLPVDRAADPMLVARFQREALAAAALSHRNIVAVYDTGQDDDTHYIVMEYVTGESLSQLIRRRGPLPPADAAGISAQIASALAAAHQAGIVHRDIKPANVMVDSHGAVKVLDFGIARVASSTTLTHTSMVLGSAPYMAPEMAEGRAADARSDIYSLGCVLYELLSGRAPFTGELAAAVLHQHSTAAPRPVSSLNPSVPPELEAVVMQMLAKAPGDRPQTAEQLVGRLSAAVDTAPLAAGLPIGALPAAASGAEAAVTRALPIDPNRASADAPTRLSATAATRASRTAPTRPLAPARPSRLPRLLAATALALALAAVLAILLSPGSGPAHRLAAGRHRTTRPASSTTHPASSATQTATATTTGTTTTVASTTASTTATTQPPTLAAALGALTTLTMQGVQTGQINQQAGQQLLGQLQNIFAQYQQGHSDNALKQLSHLQQQLPQLANHGGISSSAEPGISAALSTLSTALAGATPVTSGPGGGDQGDQPGPGPKPGHGPDH